MTATNQGSVVLGMAVALAALAAVWQAAGGVSPLGLGRQGEGEIRGTVIDAFYGAPVGNVAITVQPARPGGGAATSFGDEQGGFEVGAKSPLRLTVSAGGYESKTLTLAPTDSQVVVALAPDARETARRFLEGLVEKRYEALWALLSAEERRAWPGEEAFAAFLSKKYGAHSLAFSLGEAEVRPQWSNRDTRQVYRDVTVVGVALTVNGEGVAALQGLPLALLRQEGLWRVLGPGPAARQGPILPLAPPPRKTVTVPIFTYHHVAKVEPTDSLRRGLTVTAVQLEEQLSYLQKNNYNTVSVTEVFNALYYDLPLPPRSVVLTFDDGYADAYTEAFPLLRKYGFVGTFAIVAGFVGGSGYLTWDQVKEMASAGMELVSHGWGHVNMGSLTVERAATELRTSKAMLEQMIGGPVQFFVYPAGEPFTRGTVESQQRIIQLLRQEGYIGALTTIPSASQSAEAPYQLKRIRVQGRQGLGLFVASLPK